MIKNIIAIALFVAVLFFAYRSCTSGYDQYAYFVQASDEVIFKTRLNPSDTRIIDRGRKLKEAILLMDKENDGQNGASAGKIRWYVCGGIDCDEGWENSFLADR